jgi:predicted amidohydrolase
VAATTGTLVVGGLCDRWGDTLLNGAAMVDGSGVVARYAKAHLWDREQEIFVAGDAPPTVLDTPYGRLGLMVCYDLEFPEWVRLAAEAGTEILAVPVNWPRFPCPGASARRRWSRPRLPQPPGGST